MIYNGRPLSKYEIEASAEYERVLDTIPNGRAYDRVSVLKAFPELQKAFDGIINAKLFYELTKDHNE